MNYKQVQRYIRLTELVPDLQKMVDEKKLAFTPAVEISFIRPKNQRYIAVSIEGQQSSPSLSQAQKMRELDKDSKLNGDVIDGILSQEKKEVDKVIINDTAGISHVGIYVGDGWMLHCGDPISYANLNSSYWQSHLYAYGRLP